MSVTALVCAECQLWKIKFFPFVHHRDFGTSGPGGGCFFFSRHFSEIIIIVSVVHIIGKKKCCRKLVRISQMKDKMVGLYMGIAEK